MKKAKILHLSVDDQNILDVIFLNLEDYVFKSTRFILCVFSSQPMDAKPKSVTSRTITNVKIICISGYTVAWRNLRLLHQGHVNN